MRKLILPALLLLASASALNAQEDAAARIDSLFSRYNTSPSPGLAIAVAKDGKQVLSKGYGLANLEHRIPITGSTVFDVASVSKQFAGLAVAMLASQGEVDLDADIATYVPEMAPLTTKHPITVRNLLHHTSGLRDWPATLALAGWRMDDVISYDQILRFAYAQRTLNFAPGAEYTYSNTGYNLLAETVARVGGKSFRAWTDEKLFRPLGMTNSHFQDDHLQVVANRATGYEAAPGGTFRAAPDNLTALGSSSLYSTVDDLAKWVLNFETAQVGGRTAMDLTRTRGTLTSGSTIPYAFGVSHGTYRGFANVSHSGSWAQFATFVVYFPEQRLGVVVLANSGSVNAGRAANQVADIFLGTAPAVATASTDPRTAPTVNLSPETLDRKVGVYKLGRGWYLNIRRDAATNTLRVRATNEDEFPMAARTPGDFWIEAYNSPLSFISDAQGKTVALLYRGINAPRVDPSTTRQSPPAGETREFVGIYESEELGTSYRVTQAGSALEITHFRHGTVPLSWTWAEFTTPWWFMKSVVFEKTGGRVTGMIVDVNERSRNVRFTRRELSR